MSIKSTLSIALAVVALGAVSPAFADEIPATGFVSSSVGTGYSRLPFGYDAQGKLHVLKSGSLDTARIAARSGMNAYAKAGDAAVRYDGTNQIALPPFSSNYEPDLNSH